jgi:hypothetical protein
MKVSRNFEKAKIILMKVSRNFGIELQVTKFETI